MNNPMATHEQIAAYYRDLLAMCRAGDRVAILDRFRVQRTGRAVMRGPAGWVLNMGGKHGIPAIADERNIVLVTRGKAK